VRQLILLLVAAIVVRDVVHLISFRDPIALAQITLLDLTAVLLVTIARLAGTLVGRAFAGVTVFALAAGLPLAGIGAGIDLLLGSPHLSKMSGFVGLVAIGAGLAGVGPWHALLGAALLFGGSYGLTQIHDLPESMLVLGPLVLAYLLFALETMRRPSTPTADAREPMV
jgi:hypothetical protein